MNPHDISFVRFAYSDNDDFVPIVIMILILVFLTVFGRSVATLCTCVLWYEYVRGLSEKKMVVMNEGLNSSSKDNGSPKHGTVTALS
ncbi:hypothetical protein AHAS_Ahas20G0301500 [Arachis hypogaea]